MILEKIEIRDAKGGLCVNLTLDEKSFWAFPGAKINGFVCGMMILMGHDLEIEFSTFNGHKRLDRVKGVY